MWFYFNSFCWVKNQTSPFPKGPMDGSKAQNNQSPHRASIWSLRRPLVLGLRGPRVRYLRGPRIRGLRGPRIRGFRGPRIRGFRGLRIRGLDCQGLIIWKSRVRNHLNVVQYDFIQKSSTWNGGMRAQSAGIQNSNIITTKSYLNLLRLRDRYPFKSPDNKLPRRNREEFVID